ncbi:MAG: P-loop NTPase [Candidatus Aenigmarchaeota archaeon]|nr:P-loop NTPase [Candidatus Aenigmarchaeota archaeon]
MDPRPSLIDKRVKNVRRVIAVAAGKGGVGKSSVASMLALELSKRGYKVGLMDLDFYGPSAHVILGARGIQPSEDKGIVPPEVSGIKFMSIVYYAGDSPCPIRGIDVSNSIIELLTITRWGDLDFLVLDMPPGFGDSTLDVIRLLKKTEFVVVYTPSKVVIETVEKLVKMLKENKVSILGLVENMKTRGSDSAKRELKDFGIPFLGSIWLDKGFENSTGSPEKLLKTHFIKDIRSIIPKLKARKVR